MASGLFPTEVPSAVTTDSSRDHSEALLSSRKRKNRPPPNVIRIHAKPRPNSHLTKSRLASKSSIPLLSDTPASDEASTDPDARFKLFAPKRRLSVRARTDFSMTSITQAVLADPSDLPDSVEELKTVIRQITILQTRRLESADYYEAQQLERILLALKQKLAVQLDRKTEIFATEQALKRNELQAIIDSFLNDWNHDFEEFMHATARKAAEIKNRQDEELALLDASAPVGLGAQYRQRSAALIDLREKEHALALNHRFVAAQQTKARADEMEAREIDHQIQKMYDDFENRRERLLSQQKRDLTVYFTHVEMTRAKMIDQRDRLVEGYRNRMAMIDGRLSRLCDSGAVSPDEVSQLKVDRKRVQQVVEGEHSYPIPRMRPGTSFTNARQQNTRITPRLS
jgi:hypothetical protein